MSAGATYTLDEAGVVRLAELLALKLRAGDVVALSGDLGAGKTTFARAIIRALLGDPQAEVPSPTFSLAQAYDAPRLSVTHVDCYRLAQAEDAAELGLDEAAARGALVLEWPERIEGLLPEDRIDIHFAETDDAATRRVTLRARGPAVLEFLRGTW